MELVAKTRIPFPRDLVFRTLRDELTRLVPHMPNVKDIAVRSREEKGGRVRLVNEWTATTELPAPARRFISADRLSWLDHAAWDESAFVCEWRIETPALDGVLDCRGTNVYRPAGDGTELEITGELEVHLEKVKVPRLLIGTARPVVERLVIAGIKPNLLAIGDGVAGFLRAKKNG